MMSHSYTVRNDTVFPEVLIVFDLVNEFLGNPKVNCSVYTSPLLVSVLSHTTAVHILSYSFIFLGVSFVLTSDQHAGLSK